MLTVETFDTLSEAAAALGPDARFLAGGTLVMRAANYADPDFSRIVRTRDASLGRIVAQSDRISIGAGVTMSAVIGSSELAFLEPVARSVGGPAVRNMATVGGNLFAPHPYGDFTAALLALDAQVEIVGRGSTPLETFLAGRDATPGLVASVSVMRPGSGDFRFLKVSRVKPKGVSVLSIAAWLPRTGGRISNARVAFAAMGPVPLRAKSVEVSLEGATLDEGGVARALDATNQDLDPQDDALASAWYRREVAPVHLRRLLLGDRGYGA